MPNPAKWFLQFAAGGEGRPWADGTAMADRFGQHDPWDEQCEVTPLIGGFAGMSAIREALEDTIADAEGSGNAMGERGHVYIAGWRFNPLRELANNPTAWPVPRPSVQKDQTAIGLVLRLMQAGVRVRILVWLPTILETAAIGLEAHVEDHYFLARAVGHASDQVGLSDPIGVVALDARVAEGSVAGAHHQKTIVIRGLGDNHVAFCGGVDLGFTRRDAPAAVPPVEPAFYNGDWQSGAGIPVWIKNTATPTDSWPRDASTDYTSLAGMTVPEDRQPSDLDGREGASPFRDIYGTDNQIWHDQHLKLRGPIVRTLEQQFAERWRDSANLYDLSQPTNWHAGQVIFSTPAAIDTDDDVVALPDTQPAASPAGAASPVQMWRTIPWRNARTRPPFERAEFTAMGGVNHAVQQSKELIWIFDQYFWSMPLARQINHELIHKSGLRVIVILPPYADVKQAIAHEARARALDALCDGVRSQVEVYNLWDHRNAGRGIYCHAKGQTYDGGLLVCGSANLNRRSFLCDSELDCAVADEAVVLAHQQRLWTLLFRDLTSAAGQFPPVANLDADQAGATFFTAFKAAAGDPLAYVRPDPWESTAPALPNGVALPRGHPLTGFMVDHFFDPTSVDPALIEGKVVVSAGVGAIQKRPALLDDVVRRLEATTVRGDDVLMPNRRQSSEIRLPLTEMDPDVAL